MDPDELAAALFDDDDDDNENSFSIRRIKKETGFNEEGFLDEASNQTAKTDDKESALTDIAPLVTERSVNTLVSLNTQFCIRRPLVVAKFH